jgi:flagellar protein FlaG
MMIEINTDTIYSVKTPKVNKVNAIDEVKDLPDRGKSLPVFGEKIQEENESPKEEDFDNLAKKLNEHVQSVHRELEFSVDKASGQTVIKVIDLETKEVIRQIPGDEALKVAKKLNEESTFEIFNSYF